MSDELDELLKEVASRLGELDQKKLEEVKRNTLGPDTSLDVDRAARLIEEKWGVDITNPMVQKDLWRQLRAQGADVSSLRNELE